MTDVALHLTPHGADLAILSGDLELDQGLATAVLISLFSDGRAERAQVPPEERSVRGWWGDSAEDRYGSALWLYSRAKLTRATIEGVREAAAAALAWLRLEGIVERVDVIAERQATNTLALAVTLVRGKARKWEEKWEATRNTDFSARGLALQILVA